MMSGQLPAIAVGKCLSWEYQLVKTHLQEQFRPAVDAIDQVCARRFGERLLGSYLAGSVAAAEAWPGASDLDWFVFLNGEPTRALCGPPSPSSNEPRARPRICVRMAQPQHVTGAVRPCFVLCPFGWAHRSDAIDRPAH